MLKHVFAAAALLLVSSAHASAQDVVVGTPPPEIRTLVDGFIDAFNSGDHAAWEAMAKAHFTAEHLAKQSPAERGAAYDELRKKFGTITVDEIRRKGPEAPLELYAEGSSGTTAWIVLHLAGFKINAITVAQETS